MDTREYLIRSGIDYDQGMELFAEQEEVYIMYLNRFINEPLLTECEKEFTAKNYEKAWKAAHALKGMALNLFVTDFGQLCQSFIIDTKNACYDEAAHKLTEMKRQYAIVTQIIKALDNK